MPREGEEKGWPAKGGKKENRTRENRSVNNVSPIFPFCSYFSPIAGRLFFFSAL